MMHEQCEAALAADAAAASAVAFCFLLACCKPTRAKFGLSLKGPLGECTWVMAVTVRVLYRASVSKAVEEEVRSELPYEGSSKREGNARRRALRDMKWVDSNQNANPTSRMNRVENEDDVVQVSFGPRTGRWRETLIPSGRCESGSTVKAEKRPKSASRVDRQRRPVTEMKEEADEKWERWKM
ncbi:MAG: hypothetical protein M1823_000011 [Watsoniomyces obsoletus]|nr:MAG: hypothetical protein M1823_000011 [Watsoniomyces obsoletus]